MRNSFIELPAVILSNSIGFIAPPGWIPVRFIDIYNERFPLSRRPTKINKGKHLLNKQRITCPLYGFQCKSLAESCFILYNRTAPSGLLSSSSYITERLCFFPLRGSRIYNWEIEKSSMRWHLSRELCIIVWPRLFRGWLNSSVLRFTQQVRGQDAVVV